MARRAALPVRADVAASRRVAEKEKALGVLSVDCRRSRVVLFSCLARVLCLASCLRLVLCSVLSAVFVHCC